MSARAKSSRDERSREENEGTDERSREEKKAPMSARAKSSRAR